MPFFFSRFNQLRSDKNKTLKNDRDEKLTRICDHPYLVNFQILRFDGFLTIWGPTFTFIGPRVFGKIFVGELVLETGKATNEMLPEIISKHWVNVLQYQGHLLTPWS